MSYDEAADFGMLYDAVPIYAARNDIGFYVAEAQRAGASAVLEHLLVRAGFRLDAMYGDMDRGPLRDESPEIVVVASRVD